MAMDDPMKHLRERLGQVPLSREADPWRLVVHRGVGGLFALGFARDRDVLLVLSSAGQSVIDCARGEVIFRDRERTGFEPESLRARRLDQPDAPAIDMAGPMGGGLRRSTGDGWQVASLSVDASEVCHILHPPGASVFFSAPQWEGHGKDARFFAMGRGREEVVAFGFSWTGRSLVLADASDLWVWHRGDD